MMPEVAEDNTGWRRAPVLKRSSGRQPGIEPKPRKVGSIPFRNNTCPTSGTFAAIGWILDFIVFCYNSLPCSK